VSPTNPENLVMGCPPFFSVGPFENMGSCMKHTGTNPRVRSQLLILLHIFGGGCNFKCESEIWGSLPQKIWGPKNIKIFGFRDLSQISPDGNMIVDRRTALKTAITPLRVYQIWWTLVYKRRKIGPWTRPTQSTFSDAHIAGAKRPCP